MKVKREGVGLVRRITESYESTDDPDAICRAFERMKGPEQRWAEYEAWCLGVLARASVDAAYESALFLTQHNSPEDSAEFLALQWLRAWSNATAFREQGNVLVAMLFAEDMGLIRERMFWRIGVDPETGERREALALREQTAARNRRVGGAAIAASAEHRKTTALQLADDIRGKRCAGISALALAKAVRLAWPEDEIPPSIRTLRKIVGQV